MGIVNAGMLGLYDDLDDNLKKAVEDVILNRSPDATEKMIDIAGTLKGSKKEELKSRGQRQRRKVDISHQEYRRQTAVDQDPTYVENCIGEAGCKASQNTF